MKFAAIAMLMSSVAPGDASSFRNLVDKFTKAKHFESDIANVNAHEAADAAVDQVISFDEGNSTLHDSRHLERQDLGTPGYSGGESGGSSSGGGRGPPAIKKESLERSLYSLSTTLLDDLKELEKEYIVGNDFFQFKDDNFEWIGSGGCSATNYTVHDYCHLESVYTCRDLCAAHDDCMGFDFAFAAAGCDGGTWCIVYRGKGKAITETQKFGLAVTSDDENPYENGRVNCVKVVDPISKEVEVLNDGDGECRLQDCMACESPWDESDSGCIAATYDECMFGCLAKERCRGFKWNGPPYAFKRCATVHADKYPDAAGKAWCEHYQVPQEVPISEALSDAWTVGGTVVHPGGGKECYVLNTEGQGADTLKQSSEVPESDSQKEFLSILVKPFSLLSMLGSSFIILEVISTVAKRKMVYHRIMCFMSIFDLTFAFTLFIGTWADPKGSGWYGASGNDGTCTVKAFFTVLSAAPAVMLNAGVGVYYILLVRYKLAEEKLEKLQPWLLFPFIFGLVGAVTCLLFGLYHPFQQFGCFVTYPPDCESAASGCDQPVHQLRLAFLHVPYWISFGIGLGCMVLLYATMSSRQEPDALRDSRNRHAALWFMIRESGQDDSQTTRARRMAKQAFWYLLAFFFTYIFATVREIIEATGSQAPFALAVLATITLPTRGLFNAMIYIRPRYLRNREKNPEMSRWWALMTPSDEHDAALGALYMRSMRVFLSSVSFKGQKDDLQRNHSTNPEVLPEEEEKMEEES